MEDKNYVLQIFLFALVCILICGGIYLPLSILKEYREEYDSIVNERDNFESIMGELRAKNRTLQAIHQVNLSDVAMAKDGVEFYSEVRRLIDKNAMNMLSMQNDNPSVLKLSLQGDYYSLINLFADWRGMPFASRITELKIKRDEASPRELVDAELTLEAWIAQ